MKYPPAETRGDERVHFVGISGIGMSALARIFLQRGIAVSGSSDRRTELTDRLVAEGAHVAIGHAAEHVAGATTVVVSTAIARDNAEYVAARENEIPIVHRGALLASLMAAKRGIAIAGTHGKTTTVGSMPPNSRMRASIAVVVGGERMDTHSNARDGAGAWLLSEADESDGSFLDLRPEIAVVTNIENDHIASDAELPRMVAAFEEFAARVPARGCVYFGIDEPRAAALAAIPRAARSQTFGLSRAAHVRAIETTFADFGSRFVVTIGGTRAGEIALGVPGAINVLDALPGVAIGLELGIPFATIASALRDFRGVRRRFEIVARTARMTVVDDYAHHPTAVEATIAAARANYSGPIVVAFQPHRYSRTHYLAHDFARALRGADRVVLTDIYAASEAPLPGVDARSIGEPLAALGAQVAYVNDVANLPEYLAREAPAGALVLILGAGSITLAAAALGRLVAPTAALAS